jgi:flagellar hook-associated protein 1
MSNFVSLNTALTGIRAAQVGLDTASHNVANANTPGYTRQRVDLTVQRPHQIAVGELGAGVNITGINRMRDAFLDARVRTSLAAADRAGVEAQILARAEAVLAEPDEGISGELTALWDSFEDWANDPSDLATRRGVVSALGALAGRINAVSTGWEQLRADTAGRQTDAVAEVNAVVGELAQLNEALASAAAGNRSANDLMDRRDTLVDRLAALTGADVTTAPDGTVRVSLDGHQVLGPDGAASLQLSGTGYAVGDEAVSLHGELGGLAQGLAVHLPALQDDLDALVADLAATLNARHAPGDPLLTVADGRVSAGVTHPNDLVAGDPAGGPHASGIAEGLANLRTERVDGSSLAERVHALAVDLGANVSAHQRAAQAQNSLAASAVQARQGSHGVSLDEEMVSLVQYQRSLEAASRVMTAVDEALNTLVNRTGLVGR